MTFCEANVIIAVLNICYIIFFSGVWIPHCHFKKGIWNECILNAYLYFAFEISALESIGISKSTFRMSAFQMHIYF